MGLRDIVAALRPGVVAVGLGTAGGLLGLLLHIPLPWMMGAMILTTIVAMNGIRLRPPGWLQTIANTILGFVVGSAFTPHVFDGAERWAFSLSAVFVLAIISTLALSVFFSRYAGFGPVTSFFASAPGNVSNMVVMGRAMGGDDRVIALIHSTRMLILVLVVPTWFQVYQGLEAKGAAALAPVPMTAVDAVVILFCCIGGHWGAMLLKMSAPSMFGPMALSAALHFFAVTEARLPEQALAVVQLMIGTSVGCRFVGYSLRRMVGIIALGAATSVLLLIIGGLVAWGLAAATGLDFMALLLSFAPGSLSLMTVISLAVGADTAFVTTHHIVRLMCVILGTPVLCRLVAGRAPPREGVE